VTAVQATTTAAPALAAVEPRRSWLDFLRAELAPTPGRFNAAVRITLAASIVLVTSITLEVPFVGVSCFVVMFLTMLAPGVTTQNSVVVAIASTLAIVVVTVSIALTMLIYRFTLDYPPLRLGAMALVFFVGMYAVRVLASPAIGILLAVVVFVTQAYADVFPDSETMVRTVLWVWVAIVYAAAVAVGVNLLLLPADPEPLLRREAAARLRAVGRAITAARGSADAQNAAATLARFAQQGSAPLLKLVGLAEVRDPALKPMHAERTAKILLLDRLIAAAALIPDLTVEPSPAQRGQLARVAAACERFATAVSSPTGALPAVSLPAVEDDDAPSALTPILAELERIVRELPLAERPSVDQPGKGASPLVADAWTNPRHAQFALKAMIAGMFCYVAYTAVDWFGIHTCIITCIFVALGSAGATVHKSALRLTGCVIGGSLALAAIVFVVPHMTSIAQLTLLVAAITMPAAWIAMGSERTAYAGLQIAFAFYLSVLQGFAPSTDVTAMRDRLVGIFFGMVVMWLVFSYVWPERAGTAMVQSLAAALRRMSELAINSGDTHRVRAAAWQALAQAERSAEFFAFEPEGLTPAGAEQARRIRPFVELTRRVLLAQAALLAHRENTPSDTVDPAADGARAAFGHAIAAALASVAQQAETGFTSDHVDVRAPLAALEAQSRRGAVTVRLEGELGLCEAFVERVEALQRAAGTV